MRTIKDALDALVKFYPRTRGGLGIHHVASGGLLLRPDQPPPLLCDTPELAIRMWHLTMVETLENTKAIGFDLLRQPTLDRWQVTMQTAHGDHRVTADRYAVVAHIGVVW